MTVLEGIRVLELAGIGPSPYGVQVLADFGAEVIRVDRPSAGADPTRHARYEALSRGRRSIILDLKRSDAQDIYLDLVARSDVVVDPFRPGVTERLGVGVGVCRQRNPRLVYVHMTGWGLEGPLADRAGHDINYLAVAGLLHGMGHADRPPTPPVNYLADFAAGGLHLVIGVLLALLERGRSGEGQAIDVAMVDGAGSISTHVHGLRAGGLWSDERESNELDGAAHYYRSYETADGRYVVVAAIEAPFYAALLDRLELEPAEWPQRDRSRWPELRERLAKIFRTRTRDAWTAHFAGTDACVSPVLDLGEAPHDAHAVARKAFMTDATGLPAPAPRLSRTPARVLDAAPLPGEHTGAILAELGRPPAEVDRLQAAGIAG